MKERPILMNGDMVRAVLDGRKTQTRRMMRVQPIGDDDCIKEIYERNMPAAHSCPFGQPGDRLYVRETFADLKGTGIEHRPTPSSPIQRIAYAADTPKGSYGDEARKEYGIKWTPSIHMPRWASRILLEIVSVRVERLQDISEEDAKAEGIDGEKEAADRGATWYDKPKRAFRFLWESINGPGSWDANPLVWVVEFKVIKP